MRAAKKIPEFLAERYKGWRSTKFGEQSALFEKLVTDGQHPRALVLSCCDSRVNITDVLDGEPGQYFVHRSIANFVPPSDGNGSEIGTAAALEFAVTVLKVPHILVVGHSGCGGVQGCHAMCSGDAPQLLEPGSFLGGWLAPMRPAFEKVQALPKDVQVAALEKQAVLQSLENLMTYGFVADSVATGDLELNAAWLDIAAGQLHGYDPECDEFLPI